MEHILKSHSYHTAAFILLDMDHFKEVNDLLGHVTGDRAIRDAAVKIQEIFRQNDIVGRFGGDEFCIFLKNIPENILNARLNELTNNLRTRYANAETSVQVTVSIGAVYICGKKEVSYLELMKAADTALYEAKKQGRNQYVLKKLSEA